jgi:hypothetical protein
MMNGASCRLRKMEVFFSILKTLTMKELIEFVNSTNMSERMAELILLNDEELIEFIPEEYLTEQVLINVIKESPTLLMSLPDHLVTEKLVEKARQYWGDLFMDC